MEDSESEGKPITSQCNKQFARNEAYTKIVRTQKRKDNFEIK
jgi:hypothetical protein